MGMVSRPNHAAYRLCTDWIDEPATFFPHWPFSASLVM